jgi:non-specific protein-tyrosine kinase
VGLAVFIINKNSTPVYQASTSLLINEAPATKATDYSSLVTSERLAQTYAQLMVKTPVLEGVINQLGLSITSQELRRQLQIQPLRDTTLIEVKVEDTNPKRAADITNTLVEVFSQQNQALQASRYETSKTSLETQLNQLEGQIQKINEELLALGNDPERQAERDQLDTTLAQYRQTYAYLLQSYEQVRLTEAQSTSNIVQVEPAVPPEVPIRPRTILNTLLAVIVSGLLATGGIFLYEALNDTIQDPDDITASLGLPVLGVIARHEIEEGIPVSCSEPRSPITEAFRALRTNIQFSSVDKPLHTLLITSPSPAEGKSTIAVNLSVVLAQNNRKTVIVDGDLRRPRVHKVLGLKSRPGITDLFVADETRVENYIVDTCADNLFALPSGDIPPNPSELLGSEKLLSILEQLKHRFDIVLIDSAPVMAVTDSAVLAPKVDGVLLVVKPGVTQMTIARQAVELLQRGGANLLGVVLNEVELKRSRYAYYKGYYYASRSYLGDDENGTKKRAWPWKRTKKKTSS